MAVLGILLIDLSCSRSHALTPMDLSTAPPRLPIETCEFIIDACAYDKEEGPDIHLGYSAELTLLSCALVCRAWLPRSLINLYRRIVLCGDERTRNVIRTIRESSDLAIRICQVKNLIKQTSNRRSPFYLVPLLLTAVPKANICVLRTVEVAL